MKKVGLFFLLFIFLFNSVGYYIVFKTIQYNIKSDIQSHIKSGVDFSELELVTFNKNNLAEIQWLKPGREMLYNNQMLDIVKSTETDSTVTFYCINDTKEKALLKGLNEHINTHVANTKSTKDDSSKKVIDTTVKIYFSTAFSFSFIQASSGMYFFTPVFNYNSALIETNSPPPEYI